MITNVQPNHQLRSWLYWDQAVSTQAQVTQNWIE